MSQLKTQLISRSSHQRWFIKKNVLELQISHIIYLYNLYNLYNLFQSKIKLMLMKANRVLTNGANMRYRKNQVFLEFYHYFTIIRKVKNSVHNF